MGNSYLIWLTLFCLGFCLDTQWVFSGRDGGGVKITPDRYCTSSKPWGNRLAQL